MILSESCASGVWVKPWRKLKYSRSLASEKEFNIAILFSPNSKKLLAQRKFSVDESVRNVVEILPASLCKLLLITQLTHIQAYHRLS